LPDAELATPGPVGQPMDLRVGKLRERRAMSRRAVILVFMIGGALLWLPVFLFWIQLSRDDFHGLLDPALLLSPAAGGFLWCLQALVPRGWLYTWIPTISTALLYRHLLHRLPLVRVSWLRTRTGSIALHGALAATLSAVIFSACITVGAMLGLHNPLLHNANTSRGFDAVPDLSPTSGTVISMVSMIGGILGAVLGTLWPVVEAPAVDAKREVSSSSVLPHSPSLPLVIGTFFVVGPLLYMPLLEVLSFSSIGGTGLLARPFSQGFTLPLLAPIGAAVWYGALFVPSAWLQTWIPTLGAAFLFWAALTRFPIRRWASNRQGKRGVLLAYTTTCAVLSVMVFTLCQSLDGLFTHEMPVTPSRGEPTGLLLSPAGHTALMAVGILGVILGGAVYVLETRKRPHR